MPPCLYLALQTNLAAPSCFLTVPNTILVFIASELLGGGMGRDGGFFYKCLSCQEPQSLTMLKKKYYFVFLLQVEIEKKWIRLDGENPDKAENCLMQ